MNFYALFQGYIVNHDMRHYSFERRSGLPLAYFDAKRNRLGGCFIIVLCVGGALALVLLLASWWLR